LHQVREYILPKDVSGLHSTPFTHMKKIWLSAEKGARQERSQVKLAWAANREEFDFSRPRYPTLHITLAALEKMARAIEDDLINDFKALLPSTFDIATVDRLPWHMLHDDATSPESFLDNEEIWDSWMKDAVVSLKQAYLDPLETKHKLVVDGKPSLPAFDQLLSLDARFQSSLVGCLVGATSVSPRAVTMCDYRYRNDGTALRNLFSILNSTAFAGGRSKAQA
jgi:hypothetical protein